MGISVHNILVEGYEDAELSSLTLSQSVNSYGHAQATFIVDPEAGEKFLQQVDSKKVKITANDDENEIVLFVGIIVNMDLKSHDTQKKELLIDFKDTAYLLDLKRANASFQKLDAKYEDILKPMLDEVEGKIQFSVTDKAIEKPILQLNETPWKFIQRMATHFNACIFTDCTAENPLLTIGLPEAQEAIALKYQNVNYSFDARHFDLISKNCPDLNIVAEDFSTIHFDGNLEGLKIGDSVKWKDKNYRVSSFHISFDKHRMSASYTVMGETAFFTTKSEQANICGRILRAQVKKVEKDKIQAHLIDIDESYDDSSTTWFPFATPYSSTDGSGWYVMPEVDDYVRIIFPSSNPEEAYASSSINSAPLKEPHNKSLKAPGGRELLFTDDGVEIIAEHQKTFILLNKDNGISVVSAKDIVIHADGNISFEANGKIQMVAQQEISAQSGQSHMKILSNQIDLGGNNIIVGE